jgi:hypothetical protein
LRGRIGSLHPLQPAARDSMPTSCAIGSSHSRGEGRIGPELVLRLLRNRCRGLLKEADINYQEGASGAAPSCLPDHPISGESRYSLRPSGLHDSVDPVHPAAERLSWYSKGEGKRLLKRG